jgi:hypothetical protein
LPTPARVIPGAFEHYAARDHDAGEVQSGAADEMRRKGLMSQGGGGEDHAVGDVAFEWISAMYAHYSRETSE